MTADRPWTPVFPVDADLARQLIARLMPELAGRTPVRVGEGWDNDVWRVDDWTFRFPRRPMAVELMRVEARVLPAIAPKLGIAVPAALAVGEPCALHPAPFVAHHFVPGTTLERAGLDAAARARLAPQIGAFLRRLHAIPVPEAEGAGAPVDARKRDIEWRCRIIADRVEGLRGTRYDPLLAPISAFAARMWAPAIGRVLCHGDFYSRHLLVDDRGDLSGVIDWGDVMISDPGIDLSIAFGFLPRAARPAFWTAYGRVDVRSVDLARITAAFYGIALASYSLDVGDVALADEAEIYLRNAAESGGSGSSAA